ncbi:hypothetical protein Tsubulata_004701 [Turnera subulata]|uniref:Uncharacterized protein n=1 Tax=Turnera subulata TaxID=218843 RepID=A0A9Q0FSB4_9ROSI|nr:hypothetical protein Tsubulata_004701 [Turnera subulata]
MLKTEARNLRNSRNQLRYFHPSTGISSDEEGGYVNFSMPGDPDEGNFVVEWGQEDLDVPDPDVYKSVYEMFSRLYIVAKVGLDLNEPLVVGIFVYNRLGQSTWLSFSYIRLGSFCYRCRKLHHTIGRFHVKPRENEERRTKSRFHFSPWLKTPLISCKHCPRMKTKAKKKSRKQATYSRKKARTFVDESTMAAQMATNLHNEWVNSLVLVAKKILKSTPVWLLRNLLP